MSDARPTNYPLWRMPGASVKALKMFCVSSWNSGTFGHRSYQRALEAYFHSPLADSDLVFESNLLRTPGPGAFLDRIMYRLLAWRWPWGQMADEDRDWFRLRAEWLASSSLRRRLRRRLQALPRPDVLHFHTQAIALRISRNTVSGIPFVVSIDNTAALLGRDHPSKIRKSLPSLFWLERRCFHAASHVVSWTERARKSVVQDYGVSGNKVTVVRPTAPEMFFNHFAGFDRSLRPKPSGNLLRLLFVGNDFARKGGHDLVAVFSQHLVGRCELDVVSNDALNLPKLPGLRNRRGLNHESSEWLALFEDADVFVMPTHEDCLPMAYIEAATAGLPIVGTSVMSVPEVVRDGVNGLAVTSGDRAALAQVVARLLGDPALRKRFGESSRRLVESEFHPIINHGPLTKIFRESAVASQIEAAKLSHTSKRALSQ